MATDYEVIDNLGQKFTIRKVTKVSTQSGMLLFYTTDGGHFTELPEAMFHNPTSVIKLTDGVNLRAVS